MGLANEIARMLESALNSLRLPANQISGQLPGATLPPGGPSGSGYPPEAHAHPLDELTQSGATLGQVVTWDGTEWVADDVVLSGPAGGDLGGTYPDPDVVALQGRAVHTAAPTDGQVLTWDNANSRWAPATNPAGFANPMTTAGDLITGGSGGAAGRLGVGGEGDVLTVVSGAPAWAAPAAAGSGWGYPADGRLTLATGVPVTSSDVTAATTLYYTPYVGSQIALYDGAAWLLRTFSELSIAVPATTNTMYDVFVYDNAGTPTLELTAWTNDTTRATALTRQNGVLVRSGAATRRYVGSFRTTGVSGQTEDSLLRRLVWNMYHRVSRGLRRIDATASWTYNSTTVRQSNNSAANQIDLVCGVAEDRLTVVFRQLVNTANNAHIMINGIGVNSTTVRTGMAGYGRFTTPQSIQAQHQEIPRVGYSYYAALEAMVTSSATGTYYGDAGGEYYQLIGDWRC